MNDMQLKTTSADAKVNDMLTLPYPTFVRAGDIPWKPWVMEGVEYKLLALDPKTNGFTCMLRVQPGVTAPVHHHLGAIEVYVVEGEICYVDSDMGRQGDYMYEPAGDIHRPVSHTGCILFAVFHGPIAGLNDDGSIAGIVDAKMMREMAEAHGTAQYLADTKH